MSKFATCATTLVLVVALLMGPGLVRADSCLMVYPTGHCIYHYSSTDHYTVGPGDPLYDPFFDRRGEVLIKTIENEIALDVYQAPGLRSFVLDEINQGYFAVGTDYDLVIDGFSPVPTTYHNILLVFDNFEPGGCIPLITVDGDPPLYDPGLGYYYPIGDLVVSTPTPYGDNFSDTVTHTIHWELCSGIRIWAFADEDYNLIHDPATECFTAYSNDTTIPVEEKTWGSVKQIYWTNE